MECNDDDENSNNSEQQSIISTPQSLIDSPEKQSSGSKEKYIQPLPNGWRQVKDSCGRIYFVHPASGKSSWTIPVRVELPWEFAEAVRLFPKCLSSIERGKNVSCTLLSDDDKSKLFSFLFKQINKKKPLTSDTSRQKTSPVDCFLKCKKAGVGPQDYTTFLTTELLTKPTKKPSSLKPKRASTEPRTLSLAKRDSARPSSIPRIESTPSQRPAIKEPATVPANRRSSSPKRLSSREIRKKLEQQQQQQQPTALMKRAQWGDLLDEAADEPVTTRMLILGESIDEISELPKIEEASKSEISLTLSQSTGMTPIAANESSMVTIPDALEMEESRLREIGLKSKLASAEAANEALKRELAQTTETLESTQGRVESLENSLAAEWVRYENMELEYIDRMEDLQNLLTNLKATSRDTPELQIEALSETISKQYFLERVGALQRELEISNTGRLRAETRAKKSSTRCVDLTRQLGEANTKCTALEEQVQSLDRGLCQANETIEVLYKTRDQLYDQIRLTREAYMINLESRRSPTKLHTRTSRRSPSRTPISRRDDSDTSESETKRNKALDVHEIFDTQSNILRLKQELIQSEKESAAFQSELKDLRADYQQLQKNFYALQNDTEEFIQNRLEDLSEKLKTVTAELEESVQSQLAMNVAFKAADDRIVKLIAHNKALQKDKDGVQDLLDALNRTHAKEMVQKQEEMETYRQNLQEIFEKDKHAIFVEYENRIDSMRQAHRAELANLLSLHRVDMEKALTAQRTKYTTEIDTINEQCRKRVDEVRGAVEVSTNQIIEDNRRDTIREINAAVQREQETARKNTDSMRRACDQEIRKIRQMDALRIMDVVASTWRTKRIFSGWTQWQTFLHAQELADFAEVYGFAMDQLNAASKVANLCLKRGVLRRKKAFDKLKLNVSLSTASRAITIFPEHNHMRRFSGLKINKPLFPTELARLLSKEIPDTWLVAPICDFVGTIPVSTEGKVTRHAFENALNELIRKTESYDMHSGPKSSGSCESRCQQLAFVAHMADLMANRALSNNENVLGSPRGQHANTLGALENVRQREDLKLQAHSLRKVAFSSGSRSPERTPGPRDRTAYEREVKALENEIEALHSQLGQAKEETWHYKRKLLSSHKD